MKKSLTAITLLSVLLPLTAWAAPSSQTPFSFSGPYGGLTLGFSSLTSHLESGDVTLDQGTTGFSYGGYAGYGMAFQGPWYFGGELGIGNTTGSAKLTGSSFNVKETQDYNFSADLRAGRVIGESTLAYAKLGWAHTEFDQNTTNATTSTSDNGTFDGIRFGAGAETLLSNNLTGRLEAIYTDYDSQTINGVKYAPTDVGVRFGLSYYFF